MGIKKGDKVKLKDGRVMVVRGCFMSAVGIMVTMRPHGASGPVDQYIPMDEIEEVVQ